MGIDEHMYYVRVLGHYMVWVGRSEASIPAN